METLSKGKDSGLIRENLAITRVESGDFDLAIDDLVEMHKDNPDDHSAIQILVLALVKAGRWETTMNYS